jgi:hypothetical protein
MSDKTARAPDRYESTQERPDRERGPAGQEYEGSTVEWRPSDEQPDVFLDVPIVKVDEIHLEVEDLRARVSLQAEVLDLAKLNVGADVALGRVSLDIKGVEAQAQLRVRLDNVASILNRVLTTIDRNPQILEHVTRGVEAATREIGSGAGQAVEDVGGGAGKAVEDVGGGARKAVEEVGTGAGKTVEDVGGGARKAVEDVGGGAGKAAEEVGTSAGETVEKVGTSAGKTAAKMGRGARRTVEKTGRTIKDVRRKSRGDQRRRGQPSSGTRNQPERSRSGSRGDADS